MVYQVWSRLTILPFLSFIAASIPLTYGHPHHLGQSLHRRNYVTSSNVADSYDFIIAGGGLAGLVLASRLSEDQNVTVLVIEAGDSGDAVSDSINPPDGTYYHSLVGTANDWAYKTVSQPKANNRVMPWPRGKVLGGSSAINGMYFVRPSELEVNAWRGLLGSDDSTSADVWNWDSFFGSMKKSETFTPPKSDVQSMANIQFNPSSFGSSGPLHVTYPGFMLPVVGDWTPSLEAAGISSTSDAYGGNNYGGFVAALSINPSNWTRSYSKSAYIDPLPPRSNLDVLVSSTVTRVVFGSDKSSSGDQVATGVEFAGSASGPKKVVNVKKEVILAGGALGSPQILMLSGVGPKDVLDSAGVPVTVELPGVGQHLQDHLAAPVAWQAKVETAGDVQSSGSDVSKQAEFLSFVNSAIAYVNGSVLFPDGGINKFQSDVANSLSDSVNTLVPSKSAEVIEGYKAIFSATQKMLTDGLGQVELLLSINAPKTILIQVALQHPLSQGRVYINSSSAFDPIAIDPQYLSHFADITTMREGIKLIRRIGQTSPMSAALGDETNPGPNVASDADIETWLSNSVNTEFHPASTCAMLPKSQGGVVNAKLQVYGTANVRVADASVFPISFSAHLGSPTFGLAEKAAEIVKAAYSNVNNTTNSSSNSSNSGGSNSDSNSGKQNSAMRIAFTTSTTVLWTLFTVFLGFISL